ncbi:MAG: hypothetical protein NTZ37_08695 [Methanoregula sp.]|nr:hypothetical protein [Methanoregula sp.]
MVEVPVDVSDGKGDICGVAAGVIPGVWAGISRSVLVGCGAPSGGDEYSRHPQQLVKKMINPARIIQEMNE